MPEIVLHAGGVIRDAPISRQTASGLREVIAPKHQASARLAAASWALPVSSDIGFSSLSALLGTAGQANYAAANLLLNAQAEERQSQGDLSFWHTRETLTC